MRVHSECLTGDVFHSLRCDCGEQLESALAMIEREGARRAALPRPGGPRHRPAEQAASAYKLQDEGLDTVDANLELGLPADLRDYGIGAQILVDLGLTSIRILTNNPKKIIGLEGYGLSVTDQIPIVHAPNPHNERYLRAKRERMGHALHHQGLALDEEMIHAEHERRTAGASAAAAGRDERVSQPLRDRRRALLRGAGGPARSRARSARSRPRRASRRRVRRAGRVRAAAGGRSTPPRRAATRASPASAR